MKLDFKIKNTITKQAPVYYRKKFRPHLIKAHELVADEIMNDVFNESPTPPELTGDLKDSFYAFVDGKLYISGPNYEGPNTTDRKGLEVGFSSEYAYIQHENLTPAGRKWNLGPVSVTLSPTPGGKFLSAKLKKHKMKYKKIIMQELRQATN